MTVKTWTVMPVCMLLMAGLPARALAEDDIARELIEQAENLMRSDGAYSEITMEIITPDWMRTLTLESWDDRKNSRSFIQILSPARDQGTTFLKLDNKLWSYLPRAERTIKIPPSMMLQSWMGSDFSNDDLVRESSYVTDYTHEYGGEETIEDMLCHKIILIPLPDAAVTWGKVEIWVSQEPLVPMLYKFYNRRGELRREMRMSDVKKMGGKELPTRWEMRTVDKEGHLTVMKLDTIEFDPVMPERIFTQQYLRNPR